MSTRPVQVMEKTTSNNTTTCKAQANFPLQLHTMLGNAEKDGYSHICSWKSHGRAFEIDGRDAFMDQVTPLYFSQKRFGSFQRQLNLWGFLQKSRRGSDPGSYYHELFLRGRPDLCLTIRRVKSIDGISRLTRNEPNFYKMKPVGLDDEPLPCHTTKQSLMPNSNPSPDHSIDSTAFDRLSNIENFKITLRTSTSPQSLLENMLVTPFNASNQISDSSSFGSHCLSPTLDIPFRRDGKADNPCKTTFALCDTINRIACVSVPGPAQRCPTGQYNKSECITQFCTISSDRNASNDPIEKNCWSNACAATEKPNGIVLRKRADVIKVSPFSPDALAKRKSKTSERQKMKSDCVNEEVDAIDDMSESDIASMAEFLLDVDFDAC